MSRPGERLPLARAPQRSRPALVICLVAFLASGCATLTSADDSAILALLNRFLVAVNTVNADEFVACFAPDATAFFPSNASAARRVGLDAIRQAVTPVFAQGPRTPPAHLGDLQIHRQGETAVVSFDAGSGSLHARRTLVLRKAAGEWKIFHLHASNVTDVS